MSHPLIGYEVGYAVRRGTWGRWHLVESIVAGAAITKCGRRMEPETRSGTPLTADAFQPVTCQVCK